MPMLLDALQALCATYPQLRIAVNFYDKSVPHMPLKSIVRADDRIDPTWMPGMRTVHWKRYLTPERVASFDVVWLFDCDLGVHPSIFPLGHIVGTLSATNATMLQPSIRAQVHGTYHSGLRVRQTHMGCLATTAKFVESQSPVFRSDAWAAFHRGVLSQISYDDLAVSDYGLDLTWCGAMAAYFPKQPTCLVVPQTAIAHFLTYSSNRHVGTSERTCKGTCTTLRKGFPQFWQNFSHHTGRCWEVKPNGLQRTKAGFAYRDWAGVVRAKQVNPSDPVGSIDLAEGEEAWLGATSVHSHYPELGVLKSALKALCNHHPKLRIILNHFDRQLPPKKSMDTDDISTYGGCFTVTWVPGALGNFWKSVLQPASIAKFSFVWVFSPEHWAVHPLAFPLNQLVESAKATDAMLVHPRLPSSPTDTDNRCLAKTSRVASLRSAVVDVSGWANFHAQVLQPLSAQDLVNTSCGLELLMCSVLNGPARKRRHASKPACVEVPRVTLATPRAYMAKWMLHDWTRRSCQQSIEHLEHRWPDDFNASAHQAPTCWVIGYRGLLTAQRQRTKRGPKTVD